MIKVEVTAFVRSYDDPLDNRPSKPFSFELSLEEMP